MKQIRIYSFALILVSALSLAAFAQTKPAAKPAGKAPAQAVKFLGKGDGIKTCPVTGEEIGNKDNHAAFFGREVYFCCPDCLATAQKNPEAYVKKTEAAQIAAVKNLPKSKGHDEEGEHANHGAMAKDQHADHAEVKFIGKGDGIETCPVTGETVNKNLKGEALGRTFYVCCEGCLETVKKNPAAYLKPAASASPATAFLGKGDGVETCPVTGEPVNKNLKGEALGRTYYVCCEGCLETVKKNPAAYLKATK